MESDDDDVYYSPQHCFGQPSQPRSKRQPEYGGLPNQQDPYYPPHLNNGPQHGYPPPIADEVDQVQDHGDVYTGSPIWHDVWAAVLYVLNLLVFIGLAVWGTMVIVDEINHQNKPMIIQIHDADDIDNSNHFRSPRSIFSSSSSQEIEAMTLRTLPAMLGISILFTALYFFCAYKFTRAFITASWWIYITFMLAGAGALFYVGWSQSQFKELYCTPAGILLGFGLAYILCYSCWRSRIALASLLLQSTMKVMRLHPTMLFVGVMGLLVQVLVTILWVLGIAGGNARLLGGARIAVTVFLMFSYFWSSQVIKNVSHTTCSGVYATYYFLEGSGKNVAKPVGQAAKRAMSYSFGSICFGSLFIAIIQALNWVGAWRVATYFYGSILLLERYPEFYNHYAYTQVAIYKKSFCQAARDTWHLVKDRSIDALLNDNRIGTFFGNGDLIIELLCGVIAWVIASNDNTIRSIPDKEWHAIILAIICGLFAILIMSIAWRIIESGTATILICLAEDSAALKRSNPELFAKFLEKYPSILRPSRESGYQLA